MRWAAARLLAAFLLLVAGWLPVLSLAQSGGEPRPLVLRDSLGHIDAEPAMRAWIDPTGQATIGEVSRMGGGPPFRAAEPDAVYRLGSEAALWMHMRVRRDPGERNDWVLEFPTPALDFVTVFQQEGMSWHAESAGDTLAVAKWAEPGRYPFFRIHLDAGEVRDVYVRIRHATSANLPVQLTTAAVQSQRLQVEYLFIGIAFGALLLLIVGSTTKGLVYRDAAFGWYAGYALLTSLAVAANTGAAAHLLWPGFDALGDAPLPMLACAAVGAATLFMRSILALRRRHPQLDRLMCALALLGLVVVLLPPLIPKAVSLPIVGVYLAVATIAVISVAAYTWWRGDLVARWVVAAYAPMVAAVLVNVAQRIFGWVPASAGSQYAVILAMMVEIPLLLVALFIRSRDRHSAQVREQALSTQDALTGLLAPHLFTDRLRQVVARHRRDGLSAAVMYIELVNHQRVREHFGASVADQSLLRSVIKLRRLVRDADTVSRVGESRFGVLLEGAASRAAVTERATRLVAAGLMPLPGLKPDVTLQFHVAAVMLNEMPLDAEEIEAGLRSQLAHMSRRTRRPIRFLEPEAPPASDAVDSVFVPSEQPAQEGSLAAGGDATALNRT